MDVECPFTAKTLLMGASSGPAFLAFFAMIDHLGLIIPCVPVRAGEMEVLFELGLGEFNLAVSTEGLTSRDVELYISVQLTFPGVRKMFAPLLTASETLAFGITI